MAVLFFAATATKWSMCKPIVFLDIDDVLCLNAPYSGFDVIDVFRGRRNDKAEVFARVFSPGPIKALRMIHEAMGGNVRYVISSSWRIYLSRQQFSEVFQGSGLQFVDDNLSCDHRWSTREMFVKGARAAEIACWLQEHHEGEPFVVIDDDVSGEGLTRGASTDAQAKTLLSRVVLCEVGEGLGHRHIDSVLSVMRMQHVAS